MNKSSPCCCKNQRIVGNMLKQSMKFLLFSLKDCFGLSANGYFLLQFSGLLIDLLFQGSAPERDYQQQDNDWGNTVNCVSDGRFDAVLGGVIGGKPFGIKLSVLTVFFENMQPFRKIGQ